jgi:hypothetical protein
LRELWVIPVYRLKRKVRVTQILDAFWERRLRRWPKTTESREVTRPGFSMREIPARASPFQTLWMIDTSVVREGFGFTAVERDLNERSRRLLAAAEAKTARRQLS